MELARSQDTAEVERLLGELALAVTRRARRRWIITLKSKVAVSLEEEDWLLLESPVRSLSLREPWHLLKANALLPGLGRVALSPEARSPRLRGEIPTDEDGNRFERVRETLAGFLAFRPILRAVRAGRSAQGAPGEEKSRAADDDAGRRRLRELIDGSGWVLHERSGVSLAADLETRGGLFQAAVESEGNDGLRLSVELARFENLDPASRRAIGFFLLIASGRMRLARPTMSADREDGTVAASLEVRFGGAPSCAEVDHALQALSVAAGFCGREVRLLKETPIAEAYLAARISTPPGRVTPTKRR